jgi:hypothetical protein
LDPLHEPSFRDAELFRKSLGLGVDIETVSESLRLPSEYPNVEYGVPLRVEEAAHVKELVAAQAALSDVIEAAAASPGFATQYFDGPTLHILASGDVIALVDEVARIAPAGSEVIVEGTTRNQVLLQRAQDAISGDISRLEKSGIHVFKVAIDPVVAKIEVTIRDTDDLHSATETLVAEYGDFVEVVPGKQDGSLFACNSRSDVGTRGGLAIHNDAKGGVTCSSGFVVKNSSTGSRYMLTAGHCIIASGGTSSTTPWTNYADTLTWGTNADKQFSVNFDEGIFRLGGSSVSPYNTYFGGGPADIRTVRSTEMTWASMVVGLFVCRSGKTSGWDCGTIHRSNVNWTDSGGDAHWHVWEVTMASDHGDSGAGYIAFERDDTYAKPAGILFGGDDGIFRTYTYYHAAFDDWALNVQVCVTSAC